MRKFDSQAGTTRSSDGGVATLATPGKTTLTQQLQRSAEGAPPSAASPDDEAARVHHAAQRGLSGPAQSLPHLDIIQRAFGPHDVSGIRAHMGGPAAVASQAIGASAYATGNSVAFSAMPDVHTAAHEAAHVVQQRGGVQLKGGVGEVGDPYERNADAVADRVVRGDSAVDLLPASPSSGGAAVQRREEGAAQSPGAPQRSAAELLEEAVQVLETALSLATASGDSAPRPAAGAADVGPNASGATGGAAATQRFSPETVAHLQAGLTGLAALHGASDAEIRRAVEPILRQVGAPGLGDTGGGAAAPVQRNTLVLGAPLLAGGPPGWVTYAVLAVATVGIIGYVAYQTSRTRARERERAEPRVIPRTTEPPMHRGRIQVQGGGLELAFPWARPTPMTKVEGLAGLGGLRLGLGRTDLSLRDEAFVSAATFITNTLHTCPPDLSRTFQNRAVRQRGGDERVDIEIRTGIAFA